ncbi:TIGR03086 family metal-binding protein [Allobranchiibius sp. GilTou38]|uniref:TIGR03086 family metal-binding protein n=1 Tax=Allobranchiibius sp. GilTou38 TaxID=2815210 RepID=UPI001AA0BA80|nr:TIGR03086 family protein [Allobranchiibius sp. GilTou38]
MKLIDAASTEFERAVRELPEDSWALRTPCDMTVRALVEHVVVGNRFTTLLLQGVSRDAARARLDADQLGTDPVSAVVDSSRDQAGAFAAALPGQLVPYRTGDVTVDTFLRFRLVDLVVHAWDLRRGAGLDEALNPELVEALLAVVGPHLEEMISYGAYGDGPSGTLPGDASAQHRLLDEFGRRP